ncbi:hypothetical protein [uncultured Cohaesibacter sp.]|uniref:hypothetical protein n=1 Tax=uncultured Cohaesibacter sp. TaxID=1002546 RepID=UPI0029C76324|nr:hypothetical protein [uncultured Cohaesibacter sp.]
MALNFHLVLVFWVLVFRIVHLRSTLGRNVSVETYGSQRVKRSLTFVTGHLWLFISTSAGESGIEPICAAGREGLGGLRSADLNLGSQSGCHLFSELIHLHDQTYFNRIYGKARNIGATHVLSAVIAAQYAIRASSKKGAKSSFPLSVRAHLKALKNKWPKACGADSIEEAAAGLDEGTEGRFSRRSDHSNEVEELAKLWALDASRDYEVRLQRCYEKRFNCGPFAKFCLRSLDQLRGRRNPSSPLLPTHRPSQADGITRAVMERYLSLTPPAFRSAKVQVLFVRDHFADAAELAARTIHDSCYKDAVFVIDPEGIEAFNGNSDPTNNGPGIATVKAPQAVCYRPGFHRYGLPGGHEAFRQDIDCVVVRGGMEGDDYGMHYVNLHRGGINGTSSEGCLTIPPNQWYEFHALVNGLLETYDQQVFYVTIVDHQAAVLIAKDMGAEANSAH